MDHLRYWMSLIFASAGVVIATVAFAGSASSAAAISDPFDRQPWLQDYAYLQKQLQDSYANLAWFASPGSGIDLPALDRRTQRALNTAETEDDARTAILGFIAGFHDGHLETAATLLPKPVLATSVAKPALDGIGATSGCAALGYAPVRSIPYSLPFESLTGSSIESDGVSRAFRASIGVSSGGTRIGIVRIPRFRDQDSPPASCLQEWTAQARAGQHIDAKVLRQKITLAWFRTLAAQLRRFHREAASAVLVDIGGNTGGNDSGDWAARLFTSGEVHSARMLITAAPSSNAYFDEQLQGLHEALDKHANYDVKVRSALQSAIFAFERRKASVDTRGCDMSWVWHEQRTWDPAGCSRLIDAGFASGQMDYLPIGAMGDMDVATSIYWPAIVDPFRGAWSGPVYILTDGRTASSAEMFAAVMQDNAIAKVVGSPTEGDGCGFIDYDEPVELPHSHLRFRIPNCVRLRADGTDEVAGITPDLLVLPQEGEDSRARAARVLEAIDADLRKAPRR